MLHSFKYIYHRSNTALFKIEKHVSKMQMFVFKFEKYFSAMQNVFDKIRFQLWHICFSKFQQQQNHVKRWFVLFSDSNTRCKHIFSIVQNVCVQNCTMIFCIGSKCVFACLQQDMHLRCKTFFSFLTLQNVYVRLNHVRFSVPECNLIACRWIMCSGAKCLFSDLHIQ